MPGVASVQARVPAHRECGREFHTLGPTEQKERSPTVFSLKRDIARQEESEDLNAQAETKSVNSLDR